MPEQRHALDEHNAKCSFDRVAWFYEVLAYIYSTGQIAAAKASQVDQMMPGDKVLYAGVGAGEDAALAAERGIELTCIDLSQSMLDRTEKKLARKNLTAQLICDDMFNHDRYHHYDIVTANFFLNAFDSAEMPKMLAHLASLIRPSGRLLIADVAVPQGPLPFRLIHRIHNAAGLVFFWALGLVSLHPIYDYTEHFANLHLQLVDTQCFRLFRVGPISYQSMTVVRAV
jgi:demethylmenaquinone methyltransferase/2-methoxy-6-polyprenyl-1,4-benzoquinol methylase